jgi:hypothetical protein
MTQGRRRGRGTAAAVAATLTLMGLTASVPAQAAGTHSYYVSPTGSDNAAGTFNHPWRSVERASKAALAPGDRLLLARGGTYHGTLRIGRSGVADHPIVVGSWGTGDLPVLTGGCVQVVGSYVSLRTLRAQACAWAGIELSGDHDSVVDSVSTGNVAGIYVGPGAGDASVQRNRVFDNRRMSVNTPGGDDDSGAFGVLVRGDRAHVAWNVISGQFAMSYDYGMDGSAVEVYGAQGARIDHNVARDNNTFSELGDPRTRNTTYAYNVVTGSQDDATFLITRGAQSSWGPVLNTTLIHNSVLLTGAHSQGFICHGGCNARILTMRANVISAVAKSGYADGPFAGGGNLYDGGLRQFTMRPDDRVGHPLFVDGAGGDLELRTGSPAVDRSTTYGYAFDARRQSLPRDGNGDGVARADVGALER